jgi:hypothetical protein
MLDWDTVISLGLDWAPTMIIVLLAAWAAWFVWRLLRRVFRLIGGKPESAPTPTQPHLTHERREPILGPTTSATTIPDAADVLALKASIDALTRQIAILEKRLVPAVPSLAPAPAAGLKGAEVIPLSVDPITPSERRKG